MLRNCLTIGASVVSILLGAGAALVVSSAGASVPEAYAVSHCTHYAVSYTVGYNCWAAEDPFPTNGPCNSADDWYCTTGYALRDGNSIFFYQQGSWEIAYLLYPAYYFEKQAVGAGSGGSIGASSGYAWAECLNVSGNGGYCETDWHD